MLSLLLILPLSAADVVHLSLSDAMTALEEHNPSLARAQAQEDAARGSRLVALSGALPTLSANGSYTRNNEEASLDLGPLFDVLGTVAEMTGQEKPEAPEAMVLQPLESFSGGASLRVPLLVPSAWVSVGAAEKGLQAADSSVEATQSSLRANAMMAIWSAAAAEAMVTAQEASVERAKTLVHSAEVAMQAGSTAPLTLLQAETDLARREGDLLQAQAVLEKARVAVGIAIGSSTPVAVELPAPGAVPVPEVESTVAEALATRGEVEAAQQQVEVARRQLLAVRLGALPTVSGSFNVFASSEPYVTGENTGWKGSIDLTWPVLQGGLRAGNDQRAQAALADAEAALEGVKLQVTQQVRNALADWRVASARVEVAGRQRQLAEEAVRVAQHAFDQGIGDATPVLDALDRLDLARAAEIDASARLGMAQVALHAATGRW